MLLQLVKAADEFLVGTFQGIVGIDFIEACRIDETEHDISEFSFRLVLVHVGYFLLKFTDSSFTLSHTCSRSSQSKPTLRALS